MGLEKMNFQVFPSKIQGFCEMRVSRGMSQHKVSAKRGRAPKKLRAGDYFESKSRIVGKGAGDSC